MGIRGAGKTTLMMQLLVNLSTDKLKHMLIAPSIEQAQSYLKALNGKKVFYLLMIVFEIPML